MPHTVLFPSNPLNDRQVDPEFQVEWEMLRWADVSRALLDHDTLVNHGEVHTRLLPTTGPLLYRGWMLTPRQYARLDISLGQRGFQMLTSPTNYWRAHQINAWYGTFAAITPRTTWVKPGSDPATIQAAATMLDSDAFIVKDYVKSRKHDWATACYAPNIATLPTIVHEFERLQAEYLIGNTVIRAYVALDKTQPEYRIWWAPGGAAYTIGVHPDHAARSHKPDLLDTTWVEQVLRPLVIAHGAHFITTDIAIQQTGDPILIEIGDGQVSGMPSDLLDDQSGGDAYGNIIGACFP